MREIEKNLHDKIDGTGFRYSPIKMDHTDILYSNNKWKEERAMAIADDSEISDTDRQQISSMLHDPYIGWGLEIGMH